MNRYKSEMHSAHYHVSGRETEKNRKTGRRQKRKDKVIFYGVSVTIICLLVFICGFTCADKYNSVQEQTVERADAGMPGADVAGEKAKPLQNGQADASAWNLRLVNASHPITESYPIDITLLKNGQSVDSRIYRDLQDMMDAARSEGLSPYICSSYRTSEKQRSLYEAKVASCMEESSSRKEAEKKAAEWVSPPGTSEHELGLAVDIVAESYQLLDKGQEETPEQKWLMEHCSEYGFILRYPNDKSDITGIGYEPWHYRYVGKKAAEEIMRQGICLEEYMQL
ncbi:M15 family metallopeptidase [Extibacter muris]|uniref:M15 family metallopeptidase n=1 Tax=Extibacter muris TaxID=1796622 RepID=UPI001D087D0E|nr:M15 family metallopeptidase [Extibacter muris]MCB6200885.1 M15 family metallopeptidase [Extibacter muris]MCQ4662215.1 M15 family metallopeptidase [Extibacter muris]MCQ4691871.1 M15 family metallopeptidase [Extibacter muris]